MTPVHSVLIVSNGHGEDTVGALLADRLAARGSKVSAYPLVGFGEAYPGTILLDPRRHFPSGGFGLRGSWRQGFADLRKGLISHWRAQRSTLVSERNRHVVAVAVGDAYCLWMTQQTGAPSFLVATAKSAYIEPHGSIELRVMKRANAIWTRDNLTARTLVSLGLPARYAGNPLMDAIPTPEGDLPLLAHTPVILFLPGSRADALANTMLLLKVAREVSALKDTAFVCALPPSLQPARVALAASAEGWLIQGDFVRLERTSVLLTHKFGSALEASTVAIGLAGTANEQAAGVGIPVVCFVPPGAIQFTRAFLTLQKRLLGDALVAAKDWKSAAASAVELLSNRSDVVRRGDVGRTRMGSRGGIEAITAHIFRYLHGEAISNTPWGSGTLSR